MWRRNTKRVGELYPTGTDREIPGGLTAGARASEGPAKGSTLTLWHGAVNGARRFPNWRLGYLLMEESDGEQVNALRALRGDASIDAFSRLIAHLDADSGFADVARPRSA